MGASLSSEGHLLIEKASPATSLQDLGRRGFQQLGLSAGGAADRHAFLWANHLLGNEANCAAIEMILGQFRARFVHASAISICGADAKVQINQRDVPLWQSLQVEAGDELSVSIPKSGLINYLAIQGGFQCAPLYGSHSMVLREGTGPFEGKALTQGSHLNFAITTPRSPRVMPAQYKPSYESRLRLRWMRGQQVQDFESDSLSALQGRPLRIGAQSNRMGYRLEGYALNRIKSDTSMESEGLPFGSIQVPPSGEPIVLLSDRQTLGGYPKIGCLAALDAYRLTQRRPGQEVFFEEADIDECEAELADFLGFFSAH